MKTKYTFFLLIIFTLTIHAEVTIIHNIQGNTINNNKHVTFKAFAFENDKIIAIGSDKDILEKFPDAVVIDGKGQSVLPGLHDAHGHVLSLGKLQNEINLMGVTSLEESLQIIQKFIDDHPDHPWILGRGWNQALWKSKKFPTYKDLDTLNTDKPIWLRRVDGHAGWANSKAMEIANSGSYLKDMPGGEIIIDENGMQTGIYIDTAMEVISKHLTSESQQQVTEKIENTLNYLASLGITSVDDAGIDWLSYEAYIMLSNENKLPIRVNAMLASWSQVLNEMINKGPVNTDNGFLQIHSIKYIMDGALGSRGAAMLAPYSDRPDSYGKIVQPEDFLENTIYTNSAKGWQAAIHAIGDRANRIAIEVLADDKAKTSELRNRIEHAQIVAFEDLKKFKEYDIIASMQPTHATSDMNMAEDRVGRKRLMGAYAWQTLLKKGVIIASGSDFPVELANPFFGLHAAVTRQDRNNKPEDGWIPIENMTVKQALESFTMSAAYANRRESQQGSIQPGKYADFILVNQNIFDISPSNIWKTKVLQTWVAGKKIYDSAGLENKSESQ